ncbi:hypothetical protein [Paenibacillus polymyxa]|uniref:hypothetical protein n=1 Tax=Paenibacillus polymyxa TaxID=1406 RepID=UPI0007EBBE63|nr:hypothetical protein [Paenibacillus polymyxa]OAZ43322.1 hypothetical protein A9Z39_22015 [Paenibacillus polymyxa]
MSSAAERATILTQELIKAQAQAIAAVDHISNKTILLEKHLNSDAVAQAYKKILAATQNS